LVFECFTRLAFVKDSRRELKASIELFGCVGVGVQVVTRDASCNVTLLMNGGPPPPTLTYSRRALKRRNRARHSSDDDSDDSQRRSKVRLEATKPTSPPTPSDASQNRRLPQGTETCSITCVSSRSHVVEKAVKVNARMAVTFSFSAVLTISLRQSLMIPIPPPFSRNTHNMYVVREAGPSGQAVLLPIRGAILRVCALRRYVDFF
jgi:hypothetical protein